MTTIFTRIVRGEIPAAKVYEDDEFLAFLDIAPANKGHVLVITKQEFETFGDIPTSVLGRMMQVTQNVAHAVVSATRAEGYNVIMNNKPAAGQTVPHAHIHIIPRFTSDTFKLEWPHQKYGGGEMEAIRKKIAENL